MSRVPGEDGDSVATFSLERHRGKLAVYRTSLDCISPGQDHEAPSDIREQNDQGQRTAVMFAASTNAFS